MAALLVTVLTSQRRVAQDVSDTVHVPAIGNVDITLSGISIKSASIGAHTIKAIPGAVDFGVASVSIAMTVRHFLNLLNYFDIVSGPFLRPLSGRSRAVHSATPLPHTSRGAYRCIGYCRCIHLVPMLIGCWLMLTGACNPMLPPILLTWA